MEEYIDKALEQQVRSDRKARYQKDKKIYIEKVLKTFERVISLKNYDDILDMVSDIFTYKLSFVEGITDIHPTMDATHTFLGVWMVDKKQHQYISKINSKARILTYDSMDAYDTGKAGLSGFIQGKYLLKLKNYIRDLPKQSFHMVSNKIIPTAKEAEKMLKYFEKYEVEQPMTRKNIEYDMEKKEYVTYDGYASWYGTGVATFVDYDFILYSFCGFNKEIIKMSGVNMKEIQSRLKSSLEKEDLYVVSFFGNKFGDNSLFKILSEFDPEA